ncbi:hypothetical protein BOSE62_30375 [Bosea sp. 62]|nr:hypothetical protein BOSE7B_30157 [Bosea sp. 7B]VVT55984.1 hypothetical protein BOS5A_130090 [Bosea sp. EC-HK365B]VXC19774.1 hypothetical protein BOSE62_30375 [Bosea sp. 62]VXC70085.1 hypothetical protein BOSE127_40154 [Bosea sp. 127]
MPAGTPLGSQEHCAPWRRSAAHLRLGPLLRRAPLRRDADERLVGAGRSEGPDQGRRRDERHVRALSGDALGPQLLCRYLDGRARGAQRDAPSRPDRLQCHRCLWRQGEPGIPAAIQRVRDGACRYGAPDAADRSARANHFVVPEALNDAKTELSQAVLTMMKVTS